MPRKVRKQGEFQRNREVSVRKRGEFLRNHEVSVRDSPKFQVKPVTYNIYYIHHIMKRDAFTSVPSIFSDCPSSVCRAGTLLLCGVFLFSVLSGCKSGNPFRRSGSPQESGTPVISSQATVLEVITVVNQNVSRVDSFFTNNATLSGEGVFNLKGEIAFKRPSYFRLRGTHAVTGVELDVGRNPEILWMWVGKAEPKAMYYCKSEDYGRCAANLDLSINPMWVIDAMGFGILDPNVPYTGPYPVDERHLEIRTEIMTPGGETQLKSIVVNRFNGLPAAVRIYDRFKMLVADARVKSFRNDPKTGITIPASVEVSCPKENNGKGMKFSIHYGTPTLNGLDAGNSHLWTMPVYQGYPPTDMAQH